jgi:hypothetical protein
MYVCMYILCMHIRVYVWKGHTHVSIFVCIYVTYAWKHHNIQVSGMSCWQSHALEKHTQHTHSNAKPCSTVKYVLNIRIHTYIHTFEATSRRFRPVSRWYRYLTTSRFAFLHAICRHVSPACHVCMHVFFIRTNMYMYMAICMNHFPACHMQAWLSRRLPCMHAFCLREYMAICI